MKYHKEKAESIRQYILSKIQSGETGIAGKTASAFGISEMTVYRYLRSMQEDNIIHKENKTYRLTSVNKAYRLSMEDAKDLSEDRIYDKYIAPEISDLSENVRNIWEYGFSEMMNNAIDHSGAKHIDIILRRDYLNTTICIKDDGIGLFNKICEHFGFPETDDAIVELFKGKLTTDSLNHSGEGIFFTSRIMDDFALISDGKVFSHDKYSNWISEADSFLDGKDKNGSLVIMRLSNHTNKTSKSIFDLYADVDGGFTTTRIPLMNIYDTFPVSRSQAKRLTRRFDSFKEVILDFAGIEDMGQGFAHEIFNKYKRLHPDISITAVNTTEFIKKMMHHVTAGD
ncbi:MAG: DUF4325 domain-containing protein [Lachnospiraceae bacterium]|nr:DUF4325 domain-containing protein [Lachnospiraceae bacterium]